MLSPFPGYLGSVWLDSKKLWSDPGFLQARDEITKRIQGLLIGLPVQDHRSVDKNIVAAHIKEQLGLISTTNARNIG